MVNNRDDLMAVIRDLRSELVEHQAFLAELAQTYGIRELEYSGAAQAMIELTVDISLGALKLLESPLEGV